MAMVMTPHASTGSSSDQKQDKPLKRTRSRPSSRDTRAKKQKQCTTTTTTKQADDDQDHDYDCDVWSLAASVGDDLGSLDDLPVPEFEEPQPHGDQELQRATQS